MIDIDPGTNSTFDDALVLARLYRTALDHLGVQATPKVTGKRGIQIWVPVADGSTFVISQPGSADRTVTFKLLDAVPDQPDALAADLIAHGCTAQVEVLSQALRVDEN
jgi:DNA primase